MAAIHYYEKSLSMFNLTWQEWNWQPNIHIQGRRVSRGFYMTELFANVTLANCLRILHGRLFCGFLAKESFIVQGKNGIDSRILTIVEVVEFPSRIICRLLWEGSLILPGKNEIEGQIYTFRAIEFPFKRFFAIFFC